MVNQISIRQNEDTHKMVKVELTILLLIGTFSAVISQQKVKISVYYETKCIDSRTFFLRQLGPTYERLHQYIDLELVPFGNVQVYKQNDGSYHYTCQHGPDECWANRVQACAISHTDQKTSLNYAVCMFNPSNYGNTRAYAQPCAERNGLNWQQISTCFNGDEGEKLIEHNWSKTYYLNPPHNFIPWIVINDRHSYNQQQESFGHLFDYLCDNYLTNVPECAY